MRSRILLALLLLAATTTLAQARDYRPSKALLGEIRKSISDEVKTFHHAKKQAKQSLGKNPRRRLEVDRRWLQDVMGRRIGKVRAVIGVDDPVNSQARKDAVSAEYRIIIGRNGTSWEKVQRKTFSSE